jgi:hypothetical protein
MNNPSENCDNYAQSTLQPVVYPASKRSACERYRQQKLRCPPREDPSEACCRCARLRLKCFTDYPRPHGRPAKRSLAGIAPRRELKPQPTTSLGQEESISHTKHPELIAPQIQLPDSVSLNRFPPLPICPSPEHPIVISPLEDIVGHDAFYFDGQQNRETEASLWPHYNKPCTHDALHSTSTTSKTGNTDFDYTDMDDGSSYFSLSGTSIRVNGFGAE